MITLDEAYVDHRQPNTFSVIVDRFIEKFDIDIDNISYETSGEYGIKFSDPELSEKFREYHKKLAKLRGVTKSLNVGRSYMGRVRLQKKDLTI